MVLKQIFEDSKGQLSSIRIMSVIALFMAMFYTIYPSISGKIVDYNVLIIWLVAAFCPKVIQKFAEREGINAKNSNNPLQ